MGDEKSDRAQRPLRFQTADCSFMMTSNISSPNVGKLISAIAAILHNQIESDRGKPRSTNPELTVFDEETYLEGRPGTTQM